MLIWRGVRSRTAPALEADVAETELDMGTALIEARIDQPGEVQCYRDRDRESDAETDRGAQIAIVDLGILGPDVANVHEGDGPDAFIGALDRHREFKRRQLI